MASEIGSAIAATMPVMLIVGSGGSSTSIPMIASRWPRSLWSFPSNVLVFEIILSWCKANPLMRVMICVILFVVVPSV